MDKQSKLPAITHQEITDTDTGEVRQLKYREGMPRSYRFDASKGIVTIGGEEPITKPGDHLSFVPVAVRVFKDALFERGRKTWAELFFVTQAGVLGAIMVHEYSVEGLLRLESELFYDDLKITDVVLTLKPVQKEKKAGEGAGNKYYIAEWGYKPAPKDLLDELARMTNGVPIYRADTAKETAKMIAAVNYTLPESALQPGEAALPEHAPETEEFEDRQAVEAGKRRAEK